MGVHDGALAAETRERRPVNPGGAHDLLPGSDGNDNDLSAGVNAPPTFRLPRHRDAALALLNSTSRLTGKAGSFVGQLVVDPTPLSDAQLEWLETLLERAELPQLAESAQ